MSLLQSIVDFIELAHKIATKAGRFIYTFYAQLVLGCFMLYSSVAKTNHEKETYIYLMIALILAFAGVPFIQRIYWFKIKQRLNPSRWVLNWYLRIWLWTKAAIFLFILLIWSSNQDFTETYTRLFMGSVPLYIITSMIWNIGMGDIYLRDLKRSGKGV